MKLFEFFGKMTLKQDHEDGKYSLSREEKETLEQSLFDFILNDTALHKKYFMPIAKSLKARYDDHTDDASKDWKEWLPMVNRGCANYFKEHNITGDPKDIFSKKLRKELCKKIENYYREGILNNEFQIGD